MFRITVPIEQVSDSLEACQQHFFQRNCRRLLVVHLPNKKHCPETRLNRGFSKWLMVVARHYDRHLAPSNDVHTYPRLPTPPQSNDQVTTGLNQASENDVSSFFHHANDEDMRLLTEMKTEHLELRRNMNL